MLTVAIVVVDRLALTTAGSIFAITQAVAVMLVAELQLLSARRRFKRESS